MKKPLDGLESYIASIELIDEGGRNDALYKTGLHLRGVFGLHGAELSQCLHEVNVAKCKPALDDGEVETIAGSVDRSNIPIGSLSHSTDEYLAKEISSFASAMTNTPNGVLTIGQFIDDCKNGKYREQIEEIRAEKDKKRRDTLKKELTAVTIQSGVCERRKHEFCENNAVVCLDFDNIEDVEEAKQKIAAVSYVFAVGTSASGNGIFALAALTKPAKNLKSMLAKMQADFDYTIDEKCSDNSRLRFVTFDPDLIGKDSVIPFSGKRKARRDTVGIEILDSFLQRVEKVAFVEVDGEGITVKTYYIRSIECLLEQAEECGLDFGKKNESPHVYTGCSWKRVEPQTFRHFLEAVGIRQGIPHIIAKDHSFVDKLEKQFASFARFPILTEDSVPKINLRNGTLHFTPNGIELRPFDKRDGLCYQLDYDYDPSASAPVFQQFLERVQPDVRVRKLLFQYIGYVFLRNMNLERILFFYGGGANGKSVFLNVIKALIGYEQCSEYTLEGISGSEYQRAAIGNKLLNVSSEISTRLGTTDTFKKIASREPLQARQPYGRAFIVKDYATNIFAMNELPKDVEQTGAFFRRFLIVPFDVRIPDEEQDPDLARKIIGNEMSGVLNYVVKGTKSLLKSGKFDIPPTILKAVERFRQESDSVATHLEENRYRPSSEHWKPLREMYDSYKTQCSDDGSRAVSKRTFSKRLRDLGYTVGTSGGKKTTVVYVEHTDEAG